MNDDVLDARFERDVRAVLSELDPGDAPHSLQARVAALPTSRVTAQRRRQAHEWMLAVLGAAAVLVLVAVAVGIAAGWLRLPGPPVGNEGVEGGEGVQPGSYRLYFEVAPLDGHAPTAAELDATWRAMETRARVVQGTATGGPQAGLPGVVAVDVEVPAEDPGRLEWMRQLLAETGEIIVVGTQGDVGLAVEGVDAEPLFGQGDQVTASISRDAGGAPVLDLQLGPGVADRVESWRRAHPGATLVLTVDAQFGVPAPLDTALGDGRISIPLSADQAGAPPMGTWLLAEFASGALPHPVREVAPEGVEHAPGITPAPVLTAAPTTELRIDLRPSPEGRQATAGETNGVADALRVRLTALGHESATVDVVGDLVRVSVDVPADEVDVVRQVVSSVGRVEVVPMGGNTPSRGQAVDPVVHPALPVDFASASVTKDQAGGPAVELTLSHDAAAVFGDWTTGHVAEYIALTVDGVVLLAPMINEPITEGEVQISLGQDAAESTGRLLAAIVGSGPLPMPVVEVAVNGEASTPSAPPASSPGDAPAVLAVSALIRTACGSFGGCAYTVVIGNGKDEWHADLAVDGTGEEVLAPGPGLPETLDPGTYTLTMTSYLMSDDLGPTPQPLGPVDATCSAEMVVEPGMELVGVTGTFDGGACTIDVLRAPEP